MEISGNPATILYQKVCDGGGWQTTFPIYSDKERLSMHRARDDTT